MKRSAVVLTVALLFAACGGGESDEQEIEAAMKGYLAAFADGDGDKLCGYLTEKAREDLLSSIKEQVPEIGTASCDTVARISQGAEAEIREGLKQLEIVDIEVDGDTATAYPAVNGEKANQARLRRVDGEWKIDQDFFAD